MMLADRQDNAQVISKNRIQPVLVSLITGLQGLDTILELH